MLIVAFFILWIGGISVRLVHLQVNQSDWLRGQALNQRRDQTKSRQLRGTIFDRTERTLAISVNLKSLYADPLEIDDVEGSAKKIAAVLKLKPNDVLKDLREAKENNKRFVWLARKLDEETAEKINETLHDRDIKKWDEPRFAGLHWREEQKRNYPHQSLAAQVIGFSNSDDIGQAGIEQSQEEILRGAVVKGWQDRDRLGRVYDESETEQREPPKNIVLTISHSIQYKVEQALEKGVKAANAKSGIAVALDPKTGEILAMANYPTFDPNKFSESVPENYTNKVLQNVYSPGSVFKIITYAGALQENLIKADGEIDCSRGFIEVGGRRFNDPHATKIMSYSNALAVSSNYAAIKTALGLGKDKFYGYARKFGFGEPTGIELPGEVRGQLRSPETWNGDSLASMSIGYEVSITALQAATAYAAIANDGVLIKPHVIKEIRQADGKIVSATEPPKSQIISAENARDLRRMLQQVVLKGTAKRAQLNGYTSAGKTPRRPLSYRQRRLRQRPQRHRRRHRHHPRHASHRHRIGSLFVRTGVDRGKPRPPSGHPGPRRAHPRQCASKRSVRGVESSPLGDGFSQERRRLKLGMARPERCVVLTGESNVRGSAEAPGSGLQTRGEFRPRPKAFEPKPGGWRRGKGPKHLKRPGISIAAHFTLWVINDFVATAGSQTAK